MARNRVIGRAGALPWRIRDDLQRFKRLTMNHAIVMGRKTYESIGRPLPGRRMIVLSRQADYRAKQVEAFSSLNEALGALGDEAEVFVVGGAEVYRAALPRADRICLTLIHRDYDGDAVMPPWDESAFVETDREDFTDPIPHSFIVLERRR